jgi:hypothetical protein
MNEHKTQPRWYQGNRWYHGLIAFLLVGILFITVSLVFTGKAFGSCPVEEPCNSPSTLASNYRHDKYDHRGRNDTFPPRIERMIKAKYRHMQSNSKIATTNALSPRRWFNRLDAGVDCYWVGGWVQMCDPNPGISVVEKNTYKVMLTCGASAVVGAAKGGGWWGAGAGSGLCFWGFMIDLW